MSFPEQPPMRTGHGKRVARHKMNGWQRALSAVLVVVVLAAVGGYLYLRFGRPAKPHLSTTPTCLAQKTPFCTGVALKQVTRKDLSSWTSVTGVFPVVVEYYQAFGKGFSKTNATQVALLGSRPFIQINPHQVSIAAIANGKYDTYLKGYATSVKQFGHAVVLSFGHEMNGTWSTWSMPFTKPATFVAAWRHIVKVFREQKVKNVTWAWDISHMEQKPPEQWYPGNKYVDWVGIDGYLRPGQTFAGQFHHVVATMRKLAHGKPILITETAVAPGRQQVAQIHELFDGARKLHLMGLVWFNVNKKEAWQLVKNSAALAAFQQEAQ